MGAVPLKRKLAAILYADVAGLLLGLCHKGRSPIHRAQVICGSGHTR